MQRHHTHTPLRPTPGSIPEPSPKLGVLFPPFMASIWPTVRCSSMAPYVNYVSRCKVCALLVHYNGRFQVSPARPRHTVTTFHQVIHTHFVSLSLSAPVSWWPHGISWPIISITWSPPAFHAGPAPRMTSGFTPRHQGPAAHTINTGSALRVNTYTMTDPHPPSGVNPLHRRADGSRLSGVNLYTTGYASSSSGWSRIFTPPRSGLSYPVFPAQRRPCKPLHQVTSRQRPCDRRVRSRFLPSEP